MQKVTAKVLISYCSAHLGKIHCGMHWDACVEESLVAVTRSVICSNVRDMRRRKEQPFEIIALIVAERILPAARPRMTLESFVDCEREDEPRWRIISDSRCLALAFLTEKTHQTPCCHCTLFSRRETRESIRQPAREKMHSTTMLDDDTDDTDVDVSCRVAVSHHRQLLGTPENLSK
ncbi:hypothetical protein ALC53_07116 [Atta colombica]|uniref:Uncharacterized protein n=1 Tax=Atta colombica TaxID=520822 RepID=A0A151I307_9HYME|nr:hypothetical protein ALC53_07116 [Atta colombica]